jgi:hypothetical protein
MMTNALGEFEDGHAAEDVAPDSDATLTGFDELICRLDRAGWPSSNAN